MKICGANLDCFFNTRMPVLFGHLYEFATPGQGEGLCYLGFGMMIAVVAAFCLLLFWRKSVKRHTVCEKIAWAAVLVISIIVGIGPTVSFGKTVLFEIPYPEFLLKIWSTFRSTGRFMWVAYYMIMLYAVYLLLTSGNRKIMNSILTVCVILQIADFYPSFIEYHEKWNKYEEVENDFVDEGGKLIGERYKHSVILPNEILNRGNKRYDFAYWAGRNEITLNDFYLARQTLEDQSEKYLEELMKGRGSLDTVYIVNRELLDEFIDCPLYWYQLDDFYVGTVQDISDVLDRKAVDRQLVKDSDRKWIWYDVDYAPAFDPVYYYYMYYGDLDSELMTAEELWEDFLNNGRELARKASVDFDPVKYRKRYSDLEEACGDDWKLYYWNFAGYGYKEGRKGN